MSRDVPFGTRRREEYALKPVSAEEEARHADRQRTRPLETDPGRTHGRPYPTLACISTAPISTGYTLTLRWR